MPSWSMKAASPPPVTLPTARWASGTPLVPSERAAAVPLTPAMWISPPARSTAPELAVAADDTHWGPTSRCVVVVEESAVTAGVEPEGENEVDAAVDWAVAPSGPAVAVAAPAPAPPPDGPNCP